jgi:hypothetical protein
MHTRTTLILTTALLIVCSSAACGPDETASGYSVTEGAGDDTNYGDNTDVVITPGGTQDDQFIVSGEPDGNCVQIEDACVEIDEAKGRYCDQDGAQADIILDENGEVLEVVCYPPPESGAPLEEVSVSEDGTVNIPQNASGSVIVFDETTNGEPLEGDITLDAERVSFFGNGVDETIIDGNLSFASNNARARGLTITGDLSVAKNSNNNAITFCKVHGSVDVQGNGMRLVNCQVFGDVSVAGNGATLVNIGVQGEWDVNSGASCHGCYSFEDEDEDFIVLEEEQGDPLSCGG